MDKARKEAERATDEQKIEYEAKLADLAAKLAAAEAKNQRALSMAQQTRAGHVYVISNVGSFGEDVYKRIGLTRRLEPMDRIRELGDASVPFDFDVHAMVTSDDAPALERELQRRFVRQQVNKVNARKEFFRVKLTGGARCGRGAPLSKQPSPSPPRRKNGRRRGPSSARWTGAPSIAPPGSADRSQSMTTRSGNKPSTWRRHTTMRLTDGMSVCGPGCGDDRRTAQDRPRGRGCRRAHRR